MTTANFALRQGFDDLDAFRATMRSSGGSLVPMSRGPWRAKLGLMHVGGLQLYWAEVPPQIRQGAVAAGDRLMATWAPSRSLLHLGHEFTPAEISVVGPGAVIDSHFRHRTAWGGVQFAPGMLAALAEGWGPRLPQAGQHAILYIGDANRAGILRAVESCLAEAVRDPCLLAHAAAAAALEDAVLHAVTRALAEPGRWTELPRTTAARQRIARAAVDCLAASPAEDCTLTQLSRRLGVAPRTLHGAFAAIYGCSPYGFIKRWRMVMVRRALLAGGEAMMVKTAALDHGFWHLGHFSVDYRAMFGESPQETRRAAIGPRRGWRSPGTAPH